jgi:hypothetical protein
MNELLKLHFSIELYMKSEFERLFSRKVTLRNLPLINLVSLKIGVVKTNCINILALASINSGVPKQHETKWQLINLVLVKLDAQKFTFLK